jgi:cytochrome c553
MVEHRGAPKLPGAVVCACFAAVACGGAGMDANPARAYLDDPAFARAELVASLVNPSDGYAVIRLAHYATGADGDWDGLPEWNPPAEPIQAVELDAPGGASPGELSPAATPLALTASVTSEDDPALIALGEAAFARYPVQVAPYFDVALASRAAAARFGVWVDDARGVGGLVRARMADGSGAVALTCSSCHARPDARGVVAPGLPNAALDVGAAILAAEGVAAALSDDPIAAWGPGRVDVTTAAGVEPARIPDLRPVRWLTHLHQDATVRARDLTALAIRIETLVVMSNEAVLRPPRVVALALAAYVRSLGDGLPPLDAGPRASAHGAEVFAATCARCHAPPGLTGAPVPLAAVGTNPTLGLSLDRGTGFYRVPSLRGASTRGPLLHDGTIPSLDALLDPARVTDAFTGRLHGSGAVPGHPFGLDLSDADRRALIAYLAAL